MGISLMSSTKGQEYMPKKIGAMIEKIIEVDFMGKVGISCYKLLEEIH
jgi:hypothetical protein